MANTTRKHLWRELLWRKNVAALATIVLFLSTASWIWDEFIQPFGLERPKVIGMLHWIPWYGWVFVGLCTLCLSVGEHAYHLIHQAEDKVEHVEAQIAAGKPQFVLTIETLIWLYDSVHSFTTFVLGAYLVNKGAPSVAMSWTAQYTVDGVTENMTGFYVPNTYLLTVGKETLTITNDTLLQAQVVTKRLETGEAKLGRMIYTVPGDRTQEVHKHEFKIRVQCFDFLGQLTFAEYIPSEVPLEGGMRLYPGERITPPSLDTKQPS
jgi:hypothetical protein